MASEIEQVNENLIKLMKDVSSIKEMLLEKGDEELELKEEFVEKMREIEKEEGIPFKNVGELRKIVEG